MSKENTPSEEVDLGSLFKIIGKGFKNLFNAIGIFFKSIFHYFILLLLFLRNNALKLGIAALVGGALGLYLDLTSPKLYSSSMIVEPNFKSTQQLYNNINFYHELVKQKDIILLAEALSISTDDAQKLKGFYIEPLRNNNEKLEKLNEYIEDLDTTVVKNININEFKNNFTDFDYKHHAIKVKSTANNIFEKLSTPIINSIENNTYFKNQKTISGQNLLQNERVLIKSLNEIDTLRKIYNEVLITEAQKTETGTSITLSQGIKKTEEVKLFQESLKLNEELIINNKEKAESTDIVNIVSTFSKLGVKERAIYRKNTFRLGALFFSLMLIFILGKQLNNYLLNYNQ